MASNPTNLADVSRQLNDIATALEGMKANGPIAVDIKSTVTDWNIFWVTLGAAFLGTFFAFASNVLYERKKERDRKWYILNRSKSALIVLLETLINFKRQFLMEFDAELQIILNHTQFYKDEASPRLLAEYNEVIRPIIKILNAGDNPWNGALKKWDSLDPPKIFVPEELAFTLDHRPDDMRVFVLIIDQLKAIDRHIAFRNDGWAKLAENTYPDFLPTAQSMVPLYETLLFRKSIKELVDLDMVLIQNAVLRIEEYCKKYYPKFFFILRPFVPKRKAVMYSLPEHIQKIMPDPAQFSDVINWKNQS